MSYDEQLKQLEQIVSEIETGQLSIDQLATKVKMATKLLAERKQFGYPPFVRIIRVTMRSTETERLVASSLRLGEQLRNRFGRRVLGPVSPLIDRIRGEYRVEIMLKIEVESSFARARAILREEIERLREERDYRNITIICDVDII